MERRIAGTRAHAAAVSHREGFALALRGRARIAGRDLLFSGDELLSLIDEERWRGRTKPIPYQRATTRQIYRMRTEPGRRVSLELADRILVGWLGRPDLMHELHTVDDA